jgi:hypothetical protein
MKRIYTSLIWAILMKACILNIHAQDDFEVVPLQDMNVVNDDIPEEIGPNDLELFQLRLEDMIDEFQEGIRNIGSRETCDDEKEIYIKSTSKLFKPGATMQVSSLNSPLISTYPIKKYLGRLKTLEARRIKIEYYEPSLISDLKRNSSTGNYHATVTIYQRFRRYNESGRLVYEDKTKKEIDVLLAFVDNEFYNEKRWDLKLGDVKVQETMP